MERQTHSDNDEHIIDIANDDDSSSVLSLDEESHYFSSRSSLAMDEEASEEGATSCTSRSGCDSLWNSMELVFTLVQIVVALVVLTVAKDEHPHKLLLAWLIGYTCGCIISTLLTLFWFLRKYNQVEEYNTTSVDGVMADLKIWLQCFFGVWLILGIAWICDGHSSPSDAPKLYKLCIVFIAFSCISFAAFLIYRCACADSVGKGQGGGFVLEGPILDDCCSICLGRYGDKEDVVRKLECSHVFHLKCINEWLRIKPACPLCQSMVKG